MGKNVGTPSMRAYAAGVKSNTPTLWWGNPGQGKSAKIDASGTASGYTVRCVVGSVREATDFLGLPVEVDGAVSYSPPEFATALNASDKGLLFLDELTTSAPSTMKAMLRLLQERYAGDYKIGDHVAIVAAANPPETSVDGMELPAPIANRLMHLDWHFDSDEWLAGVGTGFAHANQPGLDDLAGGGTDADRARATALVVGFTQSRRDLLAPEPPKDPLLAGKAWPSPRSWTNLLNVLAFIDADDEEAMSLAVQGCVGEAATKEFFAWLAISDLHNPADVLADPSIVDWRGERPDRLFGLMSGVEALAVSRGDAKTWEAAMEVLTQAAENGRPDVALPAAGSLLSPTRRPKGSRLDQRTTVAFSDLMSHTKHGFAEAGAA